MSNLESEEEVRYDYSAKSKIMLNLLGSGWSVDPSNSEKKLLEFMDFLDRSEVQSLPTSLKTINSFCADRGISLLSFGGS